MLDSNVQSLLEVSVSNDFVDDDSYGSWGDVENDASSAGLMAITLVSFSLLAFLPNVPLTCGASPSVLLS